ncbi:hypothetical protein DM02DRAFT_609779 [Periconia macrospinosa]|uniref:Cytochrome b5 heme-binding domain-containing protein n=1 Tax=Periconia macrospinosa TaxID=97972 RepID=A0A2V1E7P1_9PLEO|nr:hypothetical protein DM02DRAFT_609779 [Periconia macrospinosa]
MLVAASVIVISLSLLVYHYPPSTWNLSAPPVKRAPDSHSAHTPTQDEPPEEPQTSLPSKPDDDEGTPASRASSPSSTPKAALNGVADSPAIPTFTLNEHESETQNEDDEDEDDSEDDLPAPSFPAMNSAQRASAAPSIGLMAPPSKSASMAPPPKPSPSLMAPPPRINPSNLRALPTTSSQSMRVPTNGPLPNRGPVPNRGPPAPNGGLAPTVKTPNARGKVLLSPGHSPLDWANLQRSGKNLAGVTSLLRVTPSMLKEMNGRKGKPAWSSYQGKVYNITPYLPFHPGGEGELKRASGKDGGKLFMEVHPWVNWDNMLGECVVGIMVPEGQAPGVSSLEDMD